MDTQIETIRVSEPREVLAYIPHRLGFRPSQSAVLVSLRGPRGQVGLVMRVDLRDLVDPAVGPQLARSAVTTLDRDGARRVMCVLYTEGGDPRDAPSSLHTAVRHVRDAVEGPFGSPDVRVVTPTGYLEWDCDDDACCPRGGRPLHELESTQVGAHMVLAGSSVLDSREALVRIVRADEQARRSAARVRRRWEDRRCAAWEAGPDDVARWREESVAAWRSAVAHAGDAATGRAAPWGRLEAGLGDRRVRDAVLVALVPGTGDLAERCVRGVVPHPDDDAAMGIAMRRIMDPVDGVLPPVEECRLHERALESVVAHGRTKDQAPSLTLLAVLSWWRGDGARTQMLLEQALAQDPEYRLAVMLGHLVANAVGPGWAQRRAA